MQAISPTTKLREALTAEDLEAAAQPLLELHANNMKLEDLLSLTLPGEPSPLVVQPPTTKRKSAKEAVPVRTADQVATAKAFDVTVFQGGQSSYRDLFYEKLSECAKEWKTVDLKFYSPCLPLLNASFMGKSRLLYELAECGVFVVMWCLREDSDPSYRPPRTKNIAEWMERVDLTEISFTHGGCHLVLTALGKLGDFLQEKVKKKKKVPLVELAKEWLSMSMGDLDFWRNPLDGQTRLSYNTEESTKNSQPLQIVNLYKVKACEAAKRIHEALEKLLSDKDLDKARGNVGLVFAVDEARRLNTLKHLDEDLEPRFPWLRRVFRVFPAWEDGQIHMFAVVTDTTSTLANFAPSKAHVASLRTLEEGTDLFEPFTLVKSIDVWVKRARASLKVPAGSSAETLVQAVLSLTQNVVQQPEHVQEGATTPVVVPFESALTPEVLQAYAVMCLFGRAAYLPLYRERVNFFLKARMNEATARMRAAASLHALLKAKLLGHSENGKFSKGQALSVLGSLVSLEICAATQIAGDLSSEFMRIVAAVSKDRKCLYTLEVSEPLLALAAHYLILGGIISWVVVLEKFLSAAVRSTTSIGFRGEVAVQILCVMAWQGVMSARPADSANPSFPAATAAEYIEALVFSHIEHTQTTLENLQNPDPSQSQRPLFRKAARTPESLQREQRLRSFLDTWNQFKTGAGSRLSVRVFQFVKTFTKPTSRMLLEYYMRGSAIYCKENQEVLDLVIPATISPAGGQNVTENTMTFIGIQARLRQSQESAEYLNLWCDRVAKLPFVNAKLPFVGIFLELQPGMHATVDIQKRGRGLFIFIRGLLPGDVKGMADSDEVNDAFNALLESAADLTKFESISQWVRDEIADMFSAQPFSNF